MAFFTKRLRACRPGPEADPVGEACVRETPCDLCCGLDFELVAHLDRRGRKLPTVVCRVCGLVSHLAVPSDQELLGYYQKHYRHDYHGQRVPAPHRVVRAWRRGAELTSLLASWLQSGDEVLDIGAGLGCTVKQLEMAGLTASGIEPGTAFQDFSNRQLAARVALGTWQEVTAQPRYQLVLLVHVIEHLSSPRAALTHLRQLLAPDGKLYVECPNLYSPHAAPGRLFHPAHVYNFTPATLEMMCRSCGYAVEARFSGDRDRNLRLLLSRDSRAGDTIRADSYEQTKEALGRYNLLTYHLRSSYLRERLRGFMRDFSDHWRASRRVRQIVAECQAFGRHEASRRAA